MTVSSLLTAVAVLLIAMVAAWLFKRFINRMRQHSKAAGAPAIYFAGRSRSSHFSVISPTLSGFVASRNTPQQVALVMRTLRLQPVHSKVQLYARGEVLDRLPQQGDALVTGVRGRALRAGLAATPHGRMEARRGIRKRMELEDLIDMALMAVQRSKLAHAAVNERARDYLAEQLFQTLHHKRVVLARIRQPNRNPTPNRSHRRQQEE